MDHTVSYMWKTTISLALLKPQVETQKLDKNKKPGPVLECISFK